MSSTEVVITGLGAITPLGSNVAQLWQGIQAGKNGIEPIRAYDPNESSSEQAAKLAAEIKLSDAELAQMLKPQKANRMDRFTQLALLAAREAMLDSGINSSNTNLERADVLVSSGIGGMSTTVREYERGVARGFDKISPFYIPMTIANIAAGTIAIEHSLQGDASCVVTACASSAHAVGEAMRHVRHGYADVVLCGGSEAVVIPLAMGGFTSMQAMHTGTDPDRASIPFDAQRSGFVLGEGAGMLVLESLAHAQKRGARIYAQVAGFAATCDAYHMTAPDPNGLGAVRAMKAALADASIVPNDIDYINAHGTSTPLNDKSEVLAMRQVFDKMPPVSSTKSMTGHLLGAAGAVESIISILALQNNYLPPTINYQSQDPECAIDVVANRGREATIHAVMSNSLGFGGHNASLVFRSV